MDHHQLEKILSENPNIDRTAIERSRQAAKQLADAGIKLGGYRLTPALGGAVIKHSDSRSEQGTSGTQVRPQNQSARH